MKARVEQWAAETLADIDARHLRRHLEPLESAVGARVKVGGRELLNFSSNDYLGLANDPQVVEAGRAALLRHGLGAGASRLVVGDTAAHQSLEAALARFEGVEAATLFNSGYAANVGVVSALFGPGDVLFSDALNHASLIDGCRLSRAQVVVYPHRDVAALAALVQAHPGRRRAVLTDTVFSMDGHRAPLRALAQLCEEKQLALVVDEAHATGVLGHRGRGLSELEDVKADIHVGTLSKAVGCFGAYVAGSAGLRDVLLHRARSLVFSTALPAAVCAAAEVALQKLQNTELRARLASNINLVGERLKLAPDSAVFSVVLGDAARAMRTSQRLREGGFLVKAIRPPTVPEGTSRLRISLCATHQPEDIHRLCDAVAEVQA